ncbi:GIY-YIG nuclease superfamily protein [compost metagenome]|jgi:putative endonuclease|uniref:GIY-YIG nuclease family protein n=1 Tax=Agrobacterium tumefaciens complex TaxID=1183400 RepID=UPI000FB081DD|nr:GIY-YIG nuclease family protein [Agrobacterium tumefaciens]WHO23187.1 GIY-YIG nuclease family protein [Agrobacterium tumefaciens]
MTAEIQLAKEITFAHIFYMREGYVYILSSKRNGTLYTGITSNLSHRLYEHQNNLTPGFTTRYGVKTLVWFETYDLVTDAIAREKAIKNWPRAWKIKLIEDLNPAWDDIAHFLL